MRTVHVLKGSFSIAACGVALFCLAAFPLAARAAPTSPPAVLDRSALPASGRQTAILEVGEPGRYALQAASAQGAAIQLVDLMAGPGERAGAAGERDGRLDLFLDRGRYQVVTFGPGRGIAEVRLTVSSFRELHHPRAPLLVEHKPISDTLADLEQRSYWVEVRESRRVVLEAAGRNLADLRLWKDGGWLVDAAPTRETIEPAAGKPLLACRIVARLEPGLYLLTAYGGPGAPWAAGGDEHPFHLRFGIPTLGEAGRRRLTVSPFGADHFLVPGSANYLRLELPEATAARIEERRHHPDGDPFARGGAEELSHEITKESREPVAELVVDRGDQTLHLVTVRGRAGQPYLLQHFALHEIYTFRRSGRHWLSSIHSGHPQDSVDASAVTIPIEDGERRRLEPSLSQAVAIGAARGWARRCNLLEPLSLMLEVREGGAYEVLLRGAEAQARIVPVFASRPKNFREPSWQGSGSVWKLDAGFYELQAQPVKPGIAELALRRQGTLDRVWDLLDKDRPMQGEPVRPAVIIPAASLEWGRSYEMRFGRQPGVRTGLVLRPLPVDLAQPLPLAHRPHEEIAAPVTVAEAGALRAENDAGGFLEIAVDGSAWGAEAKLAAGEHAVRVRNPGTESVVSSLLFEPARLRSETPLPPLPEQALRPPVAFPVLGEREPRFLDLARGASATYAVRAEEPAFYLLESTGLLATVGNLRTRLLPTLARDAGSGSGRNFSVGQYLREGEYQLTVAARGSSRGHLGLRLRRAPLRSGGPLQEGTPARVSVAPGEGVVHEFRIEAGGEYRLSSSALGRAVPCRIEDADGWPLEPPGITAAITRRFEPGRYRIILLPEAVGSRRVTTLSRIPEPVRLVGHGPHPLPLERGVEHLWLESPAGEARVPDRWEFALPAPATVTISLSGEMQGDILRRAGGTENVVARVPPGRGWTGSLEAGAYAIAAVCSRRGNQVGYEIALRAKELLAGFSRTVTVPATIPVSLGRPGLYEFSTAGTADVRARLLAEDGTLLGEQEDRPDDWNVQLAQRLEPGSYRLELLPVGAGEATTTAALREYAEEDHTPLPLTSAPLEREVLPGDAVHRYPLLPPPDAGLLILRAAADETVGVAVETEAPGGWQSVWTGIGRSHRLELPLDRDGAGEASGRYRLRVWSLDRQGAPVRLALYAAVPPRFTERDLERGSALAPVPHVDPPLAVAEVVLRSPGLFRPVGEELRWRSAAARRQPLEEEEGRLILATGDRLWLATEVPEGASEVTARLSRQALAPGETLEATLPADGTPLAVDLAAGREPVLLAIVTSLAGQPGVLLAAGDAGRLRPSAAAAAVLPHGAAAMLLDPRPGVALLWDAGAEGRPSRVTARLLAFSPPAPVELRPGLASGALEGGGARVFRLAGDRSRIRLALGEGLVAAFSSGNRVEAIQGAVGGPGEETIVSEADRLTIVNAGAASAVWSLEMLPGAERSLPGPLTAAEPHQSRHAAAGTARIAVRWEVSGAPGSLHVRGAAGEPRYLGDDGRIARGADLDLRAGGILLVPHGVGTVVAWIDRPGEAAGLWGKKPPEKQYDVTPPRALVLEGASVAIRLKSQHPTVVHVRTEEPVITVVRRPGGATEADVHPDGARLDLYLPAGSAELWLRSAEGGELRGRAEVTATDPGVIGEGLGPEELLAPGAARFFSFTIEREGPVGIGVRAVPDVVECLLLDAGGRTLGSGVVQMATLKPGTYLVGLRAPAGGGTVRVRPALAGVVPPGQGPPDEVVRQYLEMGYDGTAREEPSESEAPLEAQEENPEREDP